MKNNIAVILVVLAVAAGVRPALAADSETALINSPLPAQVKVAGPVSENMPAALNRLNKPSTLADNGIKLIVARLDSLVSLRKKISAAKLTEPQKTDLLAMIDQAAGGLTDLAGQIKIGTDIQTVRGQVKSIFTDYRIYGLLIPKVNTLAGLYGLQNHLADFNNNIFVKINERLTSLQANGKNVAARQAALANAKAMAGNIETDITYTVKEITALQPADYPKTSGAVLKGGHSAFKDINRAFLKLKSFLRGTGMVR